MTRIPFFIFAILSFLFSCDLSLGPSFNPKEDKLPQPIKNRDMGFKNLKGEILYIDLKKNIYIKQTIRIPESKFQTAAVEERYFNLVRYKDTVLAFQRIIDVKTFRRIDSMHYEDMNHYYIYNLNAKKPPVFNCIEKEM